MTDCPVTSACRSHEIPKERRSIFSGSHYFVSPFSFLTCWAVGGSFYMKKFLTFSFFFDFQYEEIFWITSIIKNKS